MERGTNMALPTFDGFSLQDANYIVSDIRYRSTPKRAISFKPISRRPGVKLLSEDFGERRIRMSGHIIGSSASNLQSLIDDLHSNITRKDEGQLIIGENRTSTAIAVSVSVADPNYAQDMVPFEIEFLLADPFFYGQQHVVSLTVASGTSSESTTPTISGSVFAVPNIVYSSPSGSGNTTTSGISIEYKSTGETVTWSGGGTPVQYSGSISFDYSNQKILNGSTEASVGGVFSRWEPGEHEFVTTYSGTVVGGTLEFSYQERYL